MTTKPIKWYTLLVPNDDPNEERGYNLMDNEIIGDNTMIVCQQLDKRYFGVFINFLDFAKYCYDIVKESHRCFYEVIDRRIQKPYFDLDVHIGDPLKGKFLNKEDACLLKNEICKYILIEFPYIKEENIMVFTSHSEKKYSYHIIVDSWCVLDNEENKEFCFCLQL